jgi:tRNA(adenine34) deaminase
MCTGAIINSRIQRVVIGAMNPKAGSCGSIVNLFDLPYNHHPELICGVLCDECSALLKAFFKQLRG